MWWNLRKVSLKTLLISGSGFLLLVIVLYLSIGMTLKLWGKHQERRAKFAISIAEDVLVGYERATGKIIQSLADFPDFEVVSRSGGIKVAGREIRTGYIGGYRLFFRRTDRQRYIFSVSPMTLLVPQVEFAIMNDRQLRVNFFDIDFEENSYPDMASWLVFLRSENAETLIQP